MKKLVFLAILAFQATVFAKAITPMHVVEKASYQIDALVKKQKIDQSFLTDINQVTVVQTANGFMVQLFAPSAQGQDMNLLQLGFDSTARATTANVHFVGASSQSPIFNQISVAEILDLGAEAFVDRLSESEENVVVAENVTAIQLLKAADGVVLKINLKDSRVYTVNMDNQGNVVSKGF
ncbi:MAG: hypothetical protein FMNOHCHN_03605 [Ignavibacteriaceae bacterium]|nr:hypothetical protein [Ignavibacteriaceae bacterium]GIL17941.1 MAG: hypothetical protein BroJett040_16920 [Oligoflexia bacterium]